MLLILFMQHAAFEIGHITKISIQWINNFINVSKLHIIRTIVLSDGIHYSCANFINFFKISSSVVWLCFFLKDLVDQSKSINLSSAKLNSNKPISTYFSSKYGLVNASRYFDSRGRDWKNKAAHLLPASLYQNND